jgi:hypothetical protein
MACAVHGFKARVGSSAADEANAPGGAILNRKPKSYHLTVPCALPLSQAALHGDAANRWYDKQQLIAFKDGQMAMNFEHSYSDGLGWARFIHEVMCDVYGKQELLPPST